MLLLSHEQRNQTRGEKSPYFGGESKLMMKNKYEE